jgi:DNA mismatch endonuclease (patch repair protein)
VTDVFSKAKRSEVMSRIRSRDTGPERAIRSMLHKAGFRFRLHGAALPGKPDIVLPRFRTVILVHGCFWHRHEGCRFAYVPKSRTEFWLEKFAANVARDRRTNSALRKEGWKVITVWECELSNAEHLSARLVGRLDESNAKRRNIQENMRV